LLRGRCVHFRHPLELGGIYFLFNALKSVASWFIAAALYSRCFVAGTTESGLFSGMNTSVANCSGFLNSTGANVTGANATGANSAFAPAFQGISKPCFRHRHRCHHAREQDRRPATLCNGRGVGCGVA
jgi:hypothetical protein